MIINLFKDDKDPIYLQIVKQIKKEILNKDLKEGDLLPSIRSLATDLKVSVITTKRAYMELEKDGFVRTIAGKGTYITSKTVTLIEDEYEKLLDMSIENCYKYAKVLGLSKEELIEIFKEWSE